jgi:N-acetylmuramoyl-L-alanine amidase
MRRFWALASMLGAIALVGAPVREPPKRRGLDEISRIVGRKPDRPGPAAAPPGRGSSPVRATLSVPARVHGPETAPVRGTAEGVVLGANDLARLLDATKFWRADTRKLVVRARGHRIVLTVDNPFVLVDDRTVWLGSPVRSSRGEVQVPVTLIDALPRDSTIARLYYDPTRRNVLQVPPAGLVGTPSITSEGGTTRLVFDAERTEDVAVLSRSRAHFLLHFGGVFVGTLPDSLPGSSLVRAIRPANAAMGSRFELAIDPEVAGFRVSRDQEHERVTLIFSRADRNDLESFASEGPPGPRRIKVVAIDPGHGGQDRGVVSNGVIEKDLTLSLAKQVRAEIARRLGARVVLIREDDVSLSMEERAERANRAHADLVISLHFDGAPSPRARGATAYCPPAVFSERGVPAESGSGAATLQVLPWRDVATRHAVVSRELADRILGALDLRALGPTRLREILPYGLLGVNAPGLVLECATLTSETDRKRIVQGSGLSELATAIVDGIEAFQVSR